MWSLRSLVSSYFSRVDFSNLGSRAKMMLWTKGSYQSSWSTLDEVFWTPYLREFQHSGVTATDQDMIEKFSSSFLLCSPYYQQVRIKINLGISSAYSLLPCGSMLFTFSWLAPWKLLLLVIVDGLVIVSMSPCIRLSNLGIIYCLNFFNSFSVANYVL